MGSAASLPVADRDEVAALTRAVDAQDWPRVVQLVESHARLYMLLGPFDVLRPAVLRIPLDIAATNTTVLALRDTWLRVPDKMLLAATRLPVNTEDSAGPPIQDREIRLVKSGLWLIVALRIRGWFDEARDYAGRLLTVLDAARKSRPTEVAEIYPTLHLHAAISRMLVGDLIGALGALREAYLLASDNPHDFLESDAAGKTALTYATIGDHRRADEWLARHEAAVLADVYIARHIRSTSATARLIVAIDRLDLAAADSASAELLATDAHRELFWSFIAHAHAQYALVTGTFSEGLDEVLRARALHRSELGHGALAGPMLAAAESDLLLALGRGNQARAAAYGIHRDHHLLRVSQARLALLTGEAGEALRLATDSNWDRRAFARDRVEMLLIHAVAAHRIGDDAGARAPFTRATDAARSSGILRPFRAVPLEDLHALAVDVPAAQQLLASPALRSRPEIFSAKVALIALTPREQELLERLAGDLTRQQIANSLHISLNTVKVQLRGLFKKLDVETRADAVARGRAYGLLR